MLNLKVRQQERRYHKTEHLIDNKSFQTFFAISLRYQVATGKQRHVAH